MWPVKLRGGGCSPDLGWDRSCSWTDWLRVYPWDLRGEDVWPFIACSHPTMGMVQFGTQLCLGTWWVLYAQVQFCVGLKAVNHPLPKLLLLYLTYQKLPLSLFVSGVSHLPRLFCVSKIDAPTLRVPAPGLWASGCHGSALSALKSLLNLCKIIHLLGHIDLTCSGPTCSSGSQDQPPGTGKSPPVLRVAARLAAAAQTPVWSCARQQARKDAPGVKHSAILILSLWGNCFNNLFWCKQS